MYWFWPNADFSMKSFKNLSVSWQQDISFSEFNNKSQLIVMILPLKHIFQLHSYIMHSCPLSSEFDDFASTQIFNDFWSFQSIITKVSWLFWFCPNTYLSVNYHHSYYHLNLMILPQHSSSIVFNLFRI